MAKERQIFREKSLEKLSSPDRLDQLLRVVRPQSWLALLVVAAGIAFVLVWSVAGRIPSTAQGAGILLRPKVVVGFQSPVDGRVASVEVTENAQVRAGDLLARLDLPKLREALTLARAELEAYRKRADELAGLERERAAQEKRHLARRRALIEERMANLRHSAERFKASSDASIAQQREHLVTARQLAEQLGEELQGRYEVYKELSADNHVPADQVVNVHSSVIDNELKLAELEVTAEELNLRESEATETYDAKLDQLDALEIELGDLALEELRIDQGLREAELETEGEAEELERSIARLETQLASEGRVLSEVTGRVLEVAVSAGQRVTAGQSLGRMEIADEGAELMALAFLPVEDGKRVAPGAKIRVSPSTVERERHGSLLGTVERVSDYPVTADAAGAQIGDLATAQRLLGGENRIELLCRLERDPDSPTGFAWTSGRGPKDVRVTAGTTARVRVTIEEQAPIDLVLPFLESLTRP